MTMRFIAAVALLLLLSSGAVLGQGPTTADDIERLIAQLGSGKYAERAAAMKSLEDRGEAALPALYKVTEKGELELVRRAALLIERIENRVAVAPLLAGKKVRLTFKDVLVLDAVSDLWATTGFRLQVEGDRVPLHQRKITLDTGEVTFWEAFTQFCQVAGLTEVKAKPASDTGSPPVPYRMALMVGKTEPLPTALVGPLRVRAWPGSQNPIGLVLEVTTEPRMPWQGVSSARVTKLVDQQGKSWPLPEPHEAPPPGDAFYGRVPPPATAAVPQEVLLFRLPSGLSPSTVFKEVHATLTANVRALRKMAVIKNVTAAKGKAFPLDKYMDALKVLAVMHNGDRLRLKLRVEGPPAVPIAEEVAMRPDIAGVPLRSIRGVLLDAKGQPWKLTLADAVGGIEGDGKAFALVDMAFERQPGQRDPVQLVLSGTVSLPLEFSFVLRDVPAAKE
jgi:hypothetical protein